PIRRPMGPPHNRSALLATFTHTQPSHPHRHSICKSWGMFLFEGMSMMSVGYSHQHGSNQLQQSLRLKLT
ncbi:hypothetical protein, partial [Devosia sp. 919]|uniref:hypothetical protein n=1 Tax=Devosia sp. 919 TaxID=2726065 RepID=UPI001AEE87AC